MAIADRTSSFDPEAAAAQLHSLWNTGKQIAPFTATYAELSEAEAFASALALRKRREAGGETVVGRKLSFTNRSIWPIYNVDKPGWGYVYNSTMTELVDHEGGALSLAGTSEPRIEPEIMFGIARTPEPGMDEAALLSCIGWVAHGYEIVQSVYPGWKFRTPDVVVAYALHARLIAGPRQPLGRDPEAWIDKLRSFRLTLHRNGVAVAEGGGAVVLGSPLAALKNFNDTLGGGEAHPLLSPGEVVSTGTVTDAFPVVAGETWSTTLSGLPLPGATLSFR
jgi:2-oxo-3-hexenedioate decarboxylase